MKIKNAMANLIVADAGIVAQLGEYEFVRDVLSPAVFTNKTIPEDCESKAVRMTQVSGVPWGTRANRGGEVMIDVDVFGDKDPSDKALNEVASDIWRLLDRASLTISGYSSVLCIADPPIETGDDEDFPGYTVRCRVMALQE